MARINSACSRDAFAFGHWLCEGWTRLNKSLLHTALRTVEAAHASPPAEAPSRPLSLARPAEPARRREPCNITPASTMSLAQSGAFLDLMAQISHDLRTPLNAVIGFSDVMSAELLGPVGHPRYREYAGDIRDSGRRLLKAAEDTLAMTSLLTQSSGRTPQTMAIATLASEAWGHFTAEAEHRGITFSLETGTDADIDVLAPAHPLRQALINLLSEAMARITDGNSIVLHAIPEDDTVRLELVVAATAVRPRANPGSLAISLARTLFELQGAGLLEIEGQDGSWRAVTVLDRANQSDFFVTPRGGDPWGVAPALA